MVILFFHQIENALICDRTDSQGNYGDAHYVNGKTIIEKTKDQIRINSEAWDSTPDIVIVNSLWGGSGPGLSNLLMYYIQNDYKETIKYSLVPSPTIPSYSWEVFNVNISLMI